MTSPTSPENTNNEKGRLDMTLLVAYLVLVIFLKAVWSCKFRAYVSMHSENKPFAEMSGG